MEGTTDAYPLNGRDARPSLHLRASRRIGGHGLHGFCHLLAQPRRDVVHRPAAIRQSRRDRRAGSLPHPAGSLPAYPGDALGLGGIPWIQGEPADTRPIALLWYWPSSWTRNRTRVARIFTGGVAPAGYNVKILWTFLAPGAREKGGRNLMIRGHQLDGSGSFQAGPFSAIGYAGQRGAPAYASTIDVPQSGCWRLSLRTRGLAAQFDLWAVRRARSSR